MKYVILAVMLISLLFAACDSQSGTPGPLTLTSIAPSPSAALKPGVTDGTGGDGANEMTDYNQDLFDDKGRPIIAIAGDESDLTDSNGRPYKALATPLAVPTGRTATFVVAASDATDKEKAQADYVCDGIADNVEIQAAIDALPTDGGLIHHSSGKFIIEAPIVPRSHLTLQGTGKESTVFRLKNGANCNIIQDTSSFTSNRLSFVVRDLYLDGQSSASGYGSNTSGSGIYLAPSGTGHHWDVGIQNCFIMHMPEYGIYTNDCHGYYIENCPIENCGLDGIYLGGGGYGTIFSCTLKFDRYGIQTELATHTKIIACTFGECSGPSIIAGNYCQISENYIHSGSSSTSAISMATKDYCQVVGNWIYGANCVAINIQNGGNYNTITGNYLYGGITNAGQNNMIATNANYIAPGELRTITGTITAGVAGTITSIDNPFGQNVRVLDLQIKVSTVDVDAPNIDAGIGSSASTVYSTMFNDLPGETAGYYKSIITTPGSQTVPIEWASGSGNRYLNIAVTGNDGTSIVANYVVTVMGN